MGKIHDDIFSLPSNERLGYAMEIINTLTGSGGEDQMFFSSFGLTNSQKQVAAMLNNNPARTLTREMIYMALYGGDGDVDMKIIDVFICKIRAKIPDWIETVWGAGYRITKPFEVDATDVVPRRSKAGPTIKHNIRWSLKEDETLSEMFGNGSALWAMSDELDRTERSVSDRIRVLGLRATG